MVFTGAALHGTDGLCYLTHLLLHLTEEGVVVGADGAPQNSNTRHHIDRRLIAGNELSHIDNQSFLCTGGFCN